MTLRNVKPTMRERFVSEPITPVTDRVDVRAMARGEPGLPARFVWREEEYEVAEVVAAWKATSQCRSGANEQYVRKHWFRVRTTNGDEMKLYFERQGRLKRDRKLRWWLHTLYKAEAQEQD